MLKLNYLIQFILHYIRLTQTNLLRIYGGTKILARLLVAVIFVNHIEC